MLPLPRAQGPQQALIQIVADDDRVLRETPEADWYRVAGAQYYDALYQFNMDQARQRAARLVEPSAEPIESREQARQRLLFERATMHDPWMPTLSCCTRLVQQTVQIVARSARTI